MNPIPIIGLALVISIVSIGMYTDYKLNHFFDKHEIVECEKDISNCADGIRAVNPEHNLFFCATDNKLALDDIGTDPFKCTWREK